MDMGRLIDEYKKKKREIKQRLREFSDVSSRESIFYEMCFCTMTPQTKGKKSWETALRLKENDFMNKPVDPKPFLYRNVRFHNNKSKYLLENKKNFENICINLGAINDSRELRHRILDDVYGFGLKEASHFLRNIGHRNLAILDRHILKNLTKLNVISNLPKSLTPKKYFEIEKKFMDFSDKIGIPMDELDLLFWSMEAGEIFK